MSHLRIAMFLALVPMLLLSAGCGNDCETFCRRQGTYIGRCLPQFDEQWTDLNADWTQKSDFVGACNDQIDDRIAADAEETCVNATEGADQRACEQTVRQSVLDACAEDVTKFEQSCDNYWRGEVDFTPGVFDPPDLGDDDDSAGDDDDSAGDDDDSAN